MNQLFQFWAVSYECKNQHLARSGISRGGIKDFNLPDRVSGALKILADYSKIYRTFPKSWHIYLVAYNFFMNHPCDIIQTLNNINI